MLNYITAITFIVCSFNGYVNYHQNVLTQSSWWLSE